HHQPGHDQQGVFRQPHEVPELLQGQTGQNRQQGLAGEGVDFPLHPEEGGSGVEADQEGGDGFGLVGSPIRNTL
ncbi:hypothetical protein RZS08_61300, partial [Arthrospira platensis SPKY1]|nr:hypothetical protein [Arthrospira platensis SPKY1]